MKNPTTLLAACAALLLLPAATSAQSVPERAAAALKAGDLAAAESLVAPLAAATPPDGAALHVLSQVRVAQRRAKEAVEAAEAATKADPSRPEHFSQLGAALSLRMGEVGFMQMAMLSGRMKAAFERSVALDANHVAGLVGLCRFHTNAPEIAGGSLTKAAEYAGRVKAIVPFLGETELGRIAEKREDLPAALAHYEAALALRAESPGTLVAAGQVLAKLGRKDEARARFEAALRLAPQHEGAKRALAGLDDPAAAGGG
jgi:tetratricopeptide (TPR) repeat protein